MKTKGRFIVPSLSARMSLPETIVLSGLYFRPDMLQEVTHVAAAAESGDNGIIGFTLEGNHLSYVIILALILVATALIYVKFRV